jgi:phosphoribosylglycinamide formyltransferase-1
MIRIGVLISGEGTNLQAVLDAIADKRLDAQISCVLSNVPSAGGLERARKAGVPDVVVNHRDYATREAFDTAVVRELIDRKTDYVVLAGFMRLVTGVLLDAFPMRVINIHPALLPAFPGINAQGQALAYGVRLTGCTVHFVDAGTDTGPILAQAVVPVLDDDDDESLRARVLVEEHALLPRALQWIAERRVTVSPGRAPGDRPRVTVRGVKTAIGLAS